MAQLPSADKVYSQPNTGNSQGNIFATWNIDLNTNKGKMRVSDALKKVYDVTDDARLDGYAAQILEYGGDLFAITDRVFKCASVAINDPSDGSNWALDTTSASTTVGNSVTDAVVFDSLLLVVDGNDIVAYNGSTWASWWQGTAGQAALTVGNRIILKVGANGNLFIVDGGNKIHSVTTGGAVSIAGSDTGTLDFSATPHVFTSIETNSTRLWCGTYNASGEAVIAEWDMGTQTISANRIHKMGPDRVSAIAVWNDTPIAILGDGRVKYFNGVSFVEFENKMRFPFSKDLILGSTFMHNNGWAIIDQLPHFLVSPRIDTDNDSAYDLSNQNWQFPAGIYCLDPNIGVYCRYALTAGGSTDYGQTGIQDPGALYGKSYENTDFFASYEYSEVDAIATIVCSDRTNSRNQRAFIATAEFDMDGVKNEIKTLHRKLSAGDELRFYFRQFDRDTNVLDGTWADTSRFNSTDSITGAEKGDLVMVKIGNGAGQLSRIKSLTNSGAVNVVELEEPNTMATAGDNGFIELINFKRIGTVNNTTLDWHDLNIPSLTKSRKIQLLVEFRQGAGNINELDSVIIT